ncbi:hypothetical protein CCHL11_07084 [Colletotrichum chlorophyti]|uniref:Rhodopsin domain-containing protein n=1 Tax=Colletotrichum chlorophyti TaxID=708187 RepID=A0A1Q8S3N5_9PEZI|nr:hypothetical protein CCHL11_07084 [Colletotrichum chlorophyti]
MDPSALPPEVYADDQRTTVVGSVVFMIMLTSAVVGLRLYTRTRVITLLGIDDILAAVALLATTGCGIAIALMTTRGLGRHVALLTLYEVTEYMHMFYVSIVFYNIALLAIKMSFLCQYYRILAVPRMRRMYAVAMVIVGAWSTSQLFIASFQCLPVEGFWDKSVKARCIPNQPQWYVNAAGNIATDIAILTLPLPIFWQLALPRKQKLILIGIFSLGFFTVAISVVRIQFLSVPKDFTWANVESSLWSLGEISSAVVTACLPTLRPLMTKLFPRIFTKYSLHSHQTDTQLTKPTRAYSSLPKPHLQDMEKGRIESDTSSARSTHLKDDRSGAHSASPYQQHGHASQSTETIFGLASVREDVITPVRSTFSPTSLRPTWTSSSQAGPYKKGERNLERSGTPF